MKTLLVGFGSVGRSTLQVLTEKIPEIEVVGITNSQGTILPPFSPTDTIKGGIGNHPNFHEHMTGIQALKEQDVELLVEMSPTNVTTGGAGLTHIDMALRNGIHVVTSNKGPLALKFPELQALAQKQNAEFRFEATVAAAIPVFNLIEYCLPINIFSEINGILNGTCNYILWMMERRGGEMSIILKDAQEKGYAESDPTADIDGSDAATKLVILANVVFKRPVRFKDVDRQGIINITSDAFQIANKQDETIRLVGTASPETLEVKPKILPKSSPLNVPETMNAVNLKYDIGRELTISGFGAGGLETANAVVNDVYQVLQSCERK